MREAENVRKKNSLSDPFQPDLEYGIPEKQQKNSKKLKNIIMASFQAKTGWDRLRMREKKKSFLSIPIQSGI